MLPARDAVSLLLRSPNTMNAAKEAAGLMRANLLPGKSRQRASRLYTEDLLMVCLYCDGVSVAASTSRSVTPLYLCLPDTHQYLDSVKSKAPRMCAISFAPLAEGGTLPQAQQARGRRDIIATCFKLALRSLVENRSLPPPPRSSQSTLSLWGPSLLPVSPGHGNSHIDGP